ncbi:MAG: hypothetical protein HPY45_13215 [Anaerolineae bacterium]|nr:hypothetical protein [Anaerolineae bacterium]
MQTPLLRPARQGTAVSWHKRLDLRAIMVMYMAKIPRRAALTAALLLLLACSLPLRQKTTPPAQPAASPPAQAQVSYPPTSTPAAPPAAAEAEEPPPPPPFLDDFYIQQVESGRWSAAQGLILLLRYYTGEAEAAEVFGGLQLRNGEIDGLAARTRQYIQQDPASAESQEMQRLLDMLLPDVERILPYARPEGQASQPGAPRLALPAPPGAVQDERCTQLWHDGFRTSVSGTPPVCALYRTFSAGGATLRLFYPTPWTLGADRDQRLAWAEAALRDSADTFAGFASRPQGSIDLVFTTLTPIRVNSMDAEMAADPRGSGRCVIGAFPASLNKNEGNFKQTIAHEMFHCFQYSNIPPAHTGYERKKWWMEGSAEYFSNVVYPSNNQEFEYLGDLHANMLDTSLFHMSYENFLYFQYLANAFSNQRVVQVLQAMPESGDESETITVLNSILPNPEQLYHDYGKGYYASRIADSGGGDVPTSHQRGRVFSMGASSNVLQYTPPYTLHWFRLNFPEKKKFTLAVSTSGEGMSSAHQQMTINWGALPTSIRTACGQKEYVVLLSAVQKGSEYGIQISVTDRQDDDKCDPCLLGSWKLDPASFTPFEAAMLSPSITLSNAEAILLVTFGDDGIAVHNYEYSTVEGKTNPSGGGRAQDVFAKMTGTVQSQYQGDEGQLEFSDPQGTLDYSFWLDGQVIFGGPCSAGDGTVEAGPLNVGLGATNATYVCSEEELLITYLIPHKTVPPLRFTRVPQEGRFGQ